MENTVPALPKVSSVSVLFYFAQASDVEIHFAVPVMGGKPSAVLRNLRGCCSEKCLE